MFSGRTLLNGVVSGYKNIAMYISWTLKMIDRTVSS